MSSPLFSVSLVLLLVSLYSPVSLLAQAQPTAAPTLPKTTPAPAPSGATNVTKILEKAGQYTTLIRLFRNTHVEDQINNQLDDSSSNGMTILAPTDNAFSNLAVGTLNSLTDQQQVQLVQFHILPTFISMSQFQTLSNPVRTQAGDQGGRFAMNVTTSGNTVNITTGINNASIANSVYSDNQLAVYQVDKVLLPMNIFGPQPPAPAPSPAKAKKKSRASEGPSSASVDSSGAAGGLLGVGGPLTTTTIHACSCLMMALTMAFWL